MWRPFDKALGELAENDLLELLAPDEDDRVREGLLLEFKRDWSNDKIARAVAAFANSHGGTLMVGVEAKKLIPVGVPGVKGEPGTLEERMVQVLRSNIAPIPDFVPRAIPVRNGDACAVLVEVPEGRLPPYLHIKTGVILERTQTQSDPVPIHSRDTLDRLFAKGDRGARWGRTRAEALLREKFESLPPVDGAVFWMVPCAEDGLGRNAIVFRWSFAQAVRSHALGYWGAGPRFHHGEPTATGGYVTYTTPEFNGITHTLRVEPSGVIVTNINRVLGLPDNYMIGQVLSAHADLLESELGHRGDVAVGAFAKFEAGQQGIRTAWAVEPRIPLPEARGSTFHQRLRRQLSRSAGYGAWEPEPEEES